MDHRIISEGTSQYIDYLEKSLADAQQMLSEAHIRLRCLTDESTTYINHAENHQGESPRRRSHTNRDTQRHIQYLEAQVTALQAPSMASSPCQPSSRQSRYSEYIAYLETQTLEIQIAAENARASYTLRIQALSSSITELTRQSYLKDMRYAATVNALMTRIAYLEAEARIREDQLIALQDIVGMRKGHVCRSQMSSRVVSCEYAQRLSLEEEFVKAGEFPADDEKVSSQKGMYWNDDVSVSLLFSCIFRRWALDLLVYAARALTCGLCVLGAYYGQVMLCRRRFG